MSTATKLAAILSSKAAIKSAIEAKGVTVGNAPLSDYATKIGLISGSSNNDEDMTDLNKVYYIDHTGHVHYSYTLQEFLALLSEPANPSFTGLTPTGWQMSLSAAQAFVRANGFGPVIGLTYTTNDGTTRIYINIDEDSLKTFRIYYSGLSNANKTKLQIDWGDGSEREASTSTSGSWVHTYALQGEYVIKYVPDDNTVAYVPANLNTGVNASFFGLYGSSAYMLSKLVTKIEYGGNITGFLGWTNTTNNATISIPYGCSVNRNVGRIPYIFNTSAASSAATVLSGNISLKNVIIPEGATNFGSYSMNHNLNRVVLPSTLTGSISGVFTNCRNLKAINIPSGPTSLPNNFLQYCFSLEKIVFPNTIETFGNSLCAYCTSLKSITLPTNLTTIGTNVFQYCNSLETITLPNTITSLGNYTFSNCHKLQNVNIPTSLTTLGNYVFLGCYQLSGIITIPNTVTSIGSNCFESCLKITGLNLPNTITLIPGSLCSGCLNLLSITLPSTITSIGGNAFLNCYLLSGTINIPEGVTSIGATAFSMAVFKITEIIIPSTVTSIGNYAFNTSNTYSPETIPNKIIHVKAITPPTAGTYIFATIANIASKVTIYVPATSVDAYKEATNWKTYKDIIFAEPTT